MNQVKLHSKKMRSNSVGRRSSTIPVRISIAEREDKNLPRSESGRTAKPKFPASGADPSHIPKFRIRASSSDRTSSRGSILKTTAKTPLRHGPTTPRTPSRSASKYSNLLTVGTGPNRIHAGLPTGRRSVSADRASSMSAKSSKKDTRPLTDKTYQAHMLAKIENYFAENGCLSMLNANGSFKPITLKMFIEASAYLVKMLSIKQTLTITNYVEEMPKIAKKLHYPGSMNKSWLKTANAMHSWTNVLGWICWLVESCEVRYIACENYKLDNLPFLGTEKTSEFNKHTFLSMLNFYGAWNDTKVDEEAQMIEKYLEEIENEQGVSQEEINNLHCELDDGLEKLQIAEENCNSIDEEVKQLEELLRSLQEEEEKLQSDCIAKEKHIVAVDLEIEQINAECNALSEEIRLKNVQRDELLAAIKKQPMSAAERNVISEKCTEIVNYMGQLNDHLREIQTELYEMDLELASVNSNLTKAVLTYNKEVFKHFSGVTNVDVEELKMPEKGMLRSNIMEELNVKANLMSNLEELMKNQIAEKDHSLDLHNNELENLQERMKILEDESSDIVSMIEDKKNAMKKIKNDVKAEEAKLKKQIKVLQNDIKIIEESMPDTQKLSTELEDAKDKLNAVSRRKEYIEESARLFFDKLYEILGEHRMELFNMFK